MRIVSAFKDYYDGQQIYDKESVYVRGCKISWSKNYTSSFNNYDKFKIGFCGKIYGGLKVYNTQEERKNFCYNWDQYLEARFKNPNLELARGQLREEKRKVCQHFQVIESNELFIQENCPIFIMDVNYKHGCRAYTAFHTYNQSKTPNDFLNTYRVDEPPEFPTLSSFEFNKVIPPHIAYMELESYINGVLRREHKEIPEMSNSIKIMSHGFGKKSFTRRKN